MPVKIHDTLSKTKQPLAPADGKTFRFYCCGPTVYGPAHIGNFRTFLVQDVLRRTLEVDGLALCHVRNITDVDDKTIRQSQAESRTLAEFTEHWTKKFHADCGALNLLSPHQEPRATAHIKEQVEMIEKLVAGGHAYAAADGSVYFKVCTCDHYGELSGLDRSNLRTQNVNSAGDANDADEYDRESVTDFALWKARKPEDGENFWSSPWGEGRPGWHIECSAMSVKYLGEGFDLHGGGIDLCFPHHENEIAQSECATGSRPFARLWFHSAHLMVEGSKMSKSLGNLYTLEDLLAKGYRPMDIRYALISGHYRQQLNFTLNGLKAARSALEKMEKTLRPILVRLGLTEEEFRAWIKPSPLVTTGMFAPAWEKLSDDLNVPAALGVIFSVLGDLSDPTLHDSAVAGQLEAFGAILYALGLDLFTAADEPAAEDIPEPIADLAEARWAAKQARDWANADRLRDELLQQGWKILDRKDGYDLEKA
ncbi:cysteine--tRNA ligase [Ruficoccus sp. ZRK36]|uniref:cysteine--tRNA ligase n=1 Tax=Ruficoccus sp. ZRK36 TaxID=2866311 RepID=UPI001C737898|nr:cysteine--tRNA ligase [Ruficoccus sp. ZRK36]QYY34936.1 cysteine--tRNA ligase [Ruficoccus sp. ZRK36]